MIMELTKNANLIKLIQVLNDNPDKAKEFYNLGSSKELYDYCVSLVPGYEFDEFVEFMQNIANISTEEPVSDNKLDKVSGGGALGEISSSFFNSFTESKNKADNFFKMLSPIISFLLIKEKKSKSPTP